MKAITLLLVLCASLVVARAATNATTNSTSKAPNVPEANTFCGVTGTANKAGGWSVAGTYAKNYDDGSIYDAVPDLDTYLTLSADEFIAANNDTIACPDDYYTTFETVCQQVVNGKNYRLLFWVDCNQSDNEYLLSSVVYVPAGANSDPQVTSVKLLWKGLFSDNPENN